MVASLEVGSALADHVTIGAAPKTISSIICDWTGSICLNVNIFFPADNQLLAEVIVGNEAGAGYIC